MLPHNKKNVNVKLVDSFVSTNSMSTQPEVSFVVPVFNQVHRIKRVLDSILSVATLPHELLIIEDSSSDNTLSELKEFFSNLRAAGNYRNLVEAQLYTTSSPMFEVACDSFGFASARSPYAIEIQADMIMKDIGFDRRLVEAFKAHDDLIAISGRGVEPREPVWENYGKTLGGDIVWGTSVLRYSAGRVLARLPLKKHSKFLEERQPKLEEHYLMEIYPDAKTFKETGRAGLLGHLIDFSDSAVSKVDEGLLWIGDSVMRGPLAVDLAKLEVLGSWPEDFFFQGFDEHFICLLAHTVKSWRVAYHPVIFESPLEFGSTRKKRNIVNEIRILIFAIKFSKVKKVLSLVIERFLNTKASGDWQIRTFPRSKNNTI